MSVDEQFYVVNFSEEAVIKGNKQFCCGDAALDRYVRDNNLKRQASRGNLKAILLLDSKDNLIGFITAKINQLNKECIPNNIFPYTLPPMVTVIQIPMIAIDNTKQKQGWGTELMREAFRYTLAAAEVLPDIKGISLDAVPDAVEYYKSFDFVSISDQLDHNGNMLMFLSIETLKLSTKVTAKEIAV